MALSAQTPENPTIGAVDPIFIKEPDKFCEQYPELCIQTQCEEVARPPISTNPKNPYWLTGVPAGHYSKQLLFDWHAKVFKTYAHLPVPFEGSIGSPFFAEFQPHLNHISLFPEQRRLPDYFAKDGWELVHRSFGLDLEEKPSISLQASTYFLVLYNRYTSTLRVLSALRNGLTKGNSASFLLNFTSKDKTALFDLSNDDFKPLLEGIEGERKFFTEGLEDFSVSSDPGHWFYTDIPVVYDPCTCSFEEGDKTAEFAIQLVEKSKSLLTLRGNILGNLETKEAAKDKEGVYSSSAIRFKDIPTKGSKFLKEVGFFAKEAKTIYDKQIAAATARNKPREVARMSVFKDAMTLALNRFDQASKTSDFLKVFGTVTSSVPYLNMIVKGLDYFSVGGKAAGNTKVDVSPMKIDAGISLTGEVEESTGKGIIPILTPGLYKNAADNRSPYYNEVLGVFNLVNSPVFKMSEERGNVTYFCTACSPIGNYTEYVDRKHYRLKEPLKYVLNPAAGLVVEEVEYTLVAYTDELEDEYYIGDFNQMGGYDELKKKFIYETVYSDIQNIGNITFGAPERNVRASADLYYRRQPTHIRIRLILSRIDKGGQNVVLLYTYPIKIEKTTEDVRKSPYFSGTAFSELTRSEIGSLGVEDEKTLCGSKGYKTGRVTRKKSPTTESPAFNFINRIQVSPNPASNFVNIQYFLEQSGAVKMSVTDLSGRVIQGTAQQVNVEIGLQQMTLQLGDMASGMYILHLEMNGEKQIKRFTVVK